MAQGPGRPAHQYRARQQPHRRPAKGLRRSGRQLLRSRRRTRWRRGHGHPITGRLRALVRDHRSASISNRRSAATCSPVARMALASQRALDKPAERGPQRQHPGDPRPYPLPKRSTGSPPAERRCWPVRPHRQPGAWQAGRHRGDVAGPLAMWPVHDAVASVVMQGSGARVRDVLVAGTFAKRDGRLLRSDLGAVRAQARGIGRTHPSAHLDIQSVSRQVAAQ